MVDTIGPCGLAIMLQPQGPLYYCYNRTVGSKHRSYLYTPIVQEKQR